MSKILDAFEYTRKKRGDMTATAVDTDLMEEYAEYYYLDQCKNEHKEIERLNTQLSVLLKYFNTEGSPSDEDIFKLCSTLENGEQFEAFHFKLHYRHAAAQNVKLALLSIIAVKNKLISEMFTHEQVSNGISYALGCLDGFHERSTPCEIIEKIKKSAFDDMASFKEEKK